MAAFFRKKDEGSGSSAGESVPRASSGWRDILNYLKSNEGQRILDFGATSPNNINLLTGMGHSVYMADIVQDAARPEWRKPGADGAPEFDVDGFLKANLNFSGREFDVLLLWDSADYLPPELVTPLFVRLHEVLRPQGRVLAFFHGNMTGPGTNFSRYQLTDGPELKVIPAGNLPIQHTYAMRQIEKFLQEYADTRFFLGKDNVREVIAVR